MPYPAPDPRNFTRAGGIALYIDKGAGMVHMGNIDISKMTAEPKNTELEIESQLSGESRTAEILIIKRQETYKFPLQEITQDALQIFFLGGAVSLVGAGSAVAVDQKVVFNGDLLATLGKYGSSGLTVRQFLDKCFVYDGTDFADRSTEADLEHGMPFTTLADGGDALYLAKATKFKQVYFDLGTPGEYGAVVVKYWNGTTWAAVSSLGGAAAALGADGVMSWDVPNDWALTTVNGYTGYFIQITATTPWTTPAAINHIRQDAVRNSDYIIDPGQVSGGLQPARVGRLDAGILADGEEVKVSYTYTTWTALSFPVGTAQYTRVAARIDYLTNKGTQMRRNIPACYLKPEGNISFDAKNELQIPLSLEVLDDYANNPTAPYGTKEILS